MDLFNTLKAVYPEEADTLHTQIESLIRTEKTERKSASLTQADMMLITYGDTLQDPDHTPLATLETFLSSHLKGILSAVHILPMFPYSSDDGFAVKDYKTINPELGSWQDIQQLAQSFDLMFDAVVNHISKSSVWFKEYQKGNPEFDDFFIEYREDADYSKVVRPRSSPLFHKYETADGDKWLWTTFSEDQVDLNFHNPKVLLELLKVLILYAKMGAKFIRLDAIGFIWKESGTPCIHHENTHRLIRIMRHVLNRTVPGTYLVSETNVPHEENVSYFGEAFDEAHMVYQFPLPPLVLHAYLMHNSDTLRRWTASLDKTRLTKNATYFNFLASHDGIGMRPTEGLITDDERNFMIDHVKNQGGHVSYKANPDGSETVYELNINYFDALFSAGDSEEEHIRKFLGAHSILLSMKGVPGIYVHSLLGSRSDFQGAYTTQVPRRINREKLSVNEVEKALADPHSRRHRIFQSLVELMKIRRTKDAFHPEASKTVLQTDPRVFAFVKKGATSTVGVYVNLSSEFVNIETDMKGTDLIANRSIDGACTLEPYQYVWLENRG
ncbi:MAG: sugar phosphorylase [Bacillota bacterium]